MDDEQMDEFMDEEQMNEYFDKLEKFLENNPEHQKSLDLLRLLADESPRGMVLVIAAELDRLLGLAIKACLKKGAGLDELEKDNQGPIAAFSSKINLSHALRIIDDTELRDIHLIRKIRNDFAHETDVSFSTPSVMSRIGHLSFSSKHESPQTNLENTAIWIIRELSAAISGVEAAIPTQFTRIYGPDVP
ncbi:hypothetical protein ACIPCF_18865 (plasmid) [Paracoccus marcusii]|uniref:hypothetical protein n=1 Tax=Paracoccus marcusii TaxID=59779 RepID=UPI0038BC999C